MANPMPVLPEVGSMRIWSGSPGRSTPRRSASSISDSATRSFTEPPGFCPSSLMAMRARGLGLNALMSTSGVLPIRSSTEAYGAPEPAPIPVCVDIDERASAPLPASAAGHGGKDGHLRTVGDRRVEALQVADVVVVDVDVHELVEGTVALEDLVGHAGVLGDQL